MYGRIFLSFISFLYGLKLFVCLLSVIDVSSWLSPITHRTHDFLLVIFLSSWLSDFLTSPAFIDLTA